MRVGILFVCSAFIACTHEDERTQIKQSTVSSTTISSPAVAADSALESEKPWLPNPLPEPGDTAPNGFPTEKALLRWVHLLPVDTFPDLPGPVRTTLQNRKCQIPVPAAGRANVITGAFTAKGAVEWTVLCSVQDTSQILILNAASGAVVDSVSSRSSNAQWIQSKGNNTWQFSRMIVLMPNDVMAFVPADTNNHDLTYYGRSLPKPIDHDGIAEWFLDKGGTTWYYSQGNWVGLGSDD